jgi:hypothetical protein
MSAIYARESTRKLYWVCGLAMLALGLFGLFTGLGSPIFAGVGLLQLFVANHLGKNPIVRIHDDHLDIKLAPLASRHFVAFEDIDRVEDQGRKIVLHVGGQSVGIATNAMDEMAVNELRDVLYARLS